MTQSAFGNVHEYTVTELSNALKRRVEEEFGFVRVRGELGRVTRAASGHVYLDLKDEKSVLSSVIWKGVADRIRFAPEQGMEVIATGRMTTFPGQSRYQLVIDSLEPAGVGALMALYEERRKKLAAEGLFDAERKRALPFLPQTIGVVTSPSGAVIRDILHRLRERFPRHVIVWPTLVQGKGAERGIAAAIDGFNALPDGGDIPRPDVLIVARGGGSLEDLWCFNEEIVARAAAASRIPLISAVGHETDTTLIDFVADRRAPTPTAAAEMAVPVRAELLTELLNKERRLIGAEVRAFETRRAALLSAARGLGRPEDMLGLAAQRLDRAGDRLAAALRAFAQTTDARLQRAAARLGPRLLAAGFAEKRARAERAGDRLSAAARRGVDAKHRLLAAERLSITATARRAREAETALARLWERVLLSTAQTTRTREAALAGAGKLLETLSYENVLRRGFVLVRAGDGGLIARAADATPGAHVFLRFADGERPAAILGDGADRPKKPAPARPAKRPSQATLFDE